MPDPSSPQPYWPRPHFFGIVAGDDHSLRISAWNAAAGVTLTIAGAMARPDGGIVPFVYAHVPNTDRSRSQQIFPLEAGMMLWCHVFASAGGPIGAQCYVRLEMLQGREGGVQPLATILSGYVTANSARTYPNDQVMRSVDGAGTARSVLVAAPAAGAELLITVPPNTRWQLISVGWALLASGVAGNRTPLVIIDDGVNVLWNTGANDTITANQNPDYFAGAGLQLLVVATRDTIIPLPETLVLPAGARFRTSTGGLLAGDQYSAAVLNVIEWLDV